MNWKQLVRTNIKQVLFVCGAFFLMVLIGCLAVTSVIEREVRSSVTVGLNETEKTIQSYLREPVVAFNNIYLVIQDMLDKGVPQEEIRDYLARITDTVGEGFDGVLGFTGVYAYLRDEFVDGIGLNPDSSFIPQQRPWYQLAIRNDKAAYTAPYVDAKTKGTVISLAQEVYGKNKDYYGVLSLDVDLSWMIGYAKSLQFAPGGYGMIVNQYLYVITHPDGGFVNRPLKELGTGFAGVSQSLLHGEGVTARRMRDHDGTAIIVFFRKLYNDWYIGVVMPLSSYYSDLYRTALYLALLGLVLSTALCLLLLRLSAAKMQSDEESRSKSSFLAMMSHEIRTPLNAIIGLSEVQLQKQLPEGTHNDIETIHNSGRNLLSIINEILDLSKINARGFALTPVEYDLPSLINDAMQLNAVRTGERNIAFETILEPSLPSRLHGDELRVKQILNNLLSNAFKFTQEGRVLLGATWRREDSDAILTFSVTDTGIGIKPEDVDGLFVEYTRADRWKNRHAEGAGLGLSIARRLAESMGGTISVKSEYGKGSTFTATLRQGVVDDAPIGQGVADSLRQSRFNLDRRSRDRSLERLSMPDARVLVVDDLKTNLDVARGFLEPYGMRVDCVTGGQEAVDLVRRGDVRYDAVFMDHMMPGMDGVEAVRIIRNEIGTDYAKNIPIVALTANAVAGNEEMFLSKGFNAFVSKPISVRKLDEVLREWIAPPPMDATREEEQPAAPAAEGRSDMFTNANIDGIDLESALRRYEGNDEMYLMVLESYAKHTPDIVESLRHPAPETLAAYAVSVHGLKGSSWSIGANRVGAAAETLEQAAKRGDFEAVKAGNDSLVADATALLASVDAFLRSREPAAEERQTRGHVDAAQLADMLEACKNFDVSKMEQIMNGLEAFNYTSEKDAALVPQLREQLDQLEYDELQNLLEKSL